MAEAIFFSVIIPTLNEEKYLPRLLKNLYLQTCKNYEVLIVDGWSEDKTLGLAETFRSSLPRLTLLKTKKRNVSHQRNLGVGHSLGQWLIFLDADSQIPQNYLAKIKKYLEHDRCDVFITGFKPDSQKQFDKIFFQFANLIYEFSAKTKSPIGIGTAMGCLKSSFNQLGGFNPQCRLAEDTDLAQRLVKKKRRFCFISDTYVLYSMRRFKKEGYAKTIIKNLFYPLYQVKNPLLEDIFQYHMGGQPEADKPILQVLNDHLKKNQSLVKFNLFFDKLNLRLKDSLKTSSIRR